MVDVIVPVHGAGPVFRRCAASLIAHARDAFDVGGEPRDAAGSNAAALDARGFDATFRLVIVLDGPADAESLAAVEELRATAWRPDGWRADESRDPGGRVGGGGGGGENEDCVDADGGRCGVELEVLTHEEPAGFLRSANRAMRASTRDVVLLNSDTQVTAGWLGRLRAAAYSDPKIATVTPFSNNATICSLPRFLEENAIPAGHTIDSFGALVTRVSRREYPRLPTGVGFCLYVKRSVLDELGLFDEAFGLGYGEEVDLCFRAARRGYVHVLDDATFVFHEGSRSFGRRREHRMQRGERMMRERYPEYVTKISEFIKSDPIAPARARVLDELRPRRPVARSEAAEAPDRVVADANNATDAKGAGPTSVTSDAFERGGEGAAGRANVAERAGAAERPGGAERVSVAEHAGVAQQARGAEQMGRAASGLPRRVLHVVHGWPPWAHGEAEQHARRLVRHQSASRGVFVYARMDDPDRAFGSAVEYIDEGVRVRLIVNNYTQRDPLSRFGLRSRQVAADFEKFVDETPPDLVHVHHLAGHAIDLLGVAHRRHVPVVYQMRDWWPICARGDLIDRDGASCSGPRATKCARCLPVSGLPGATVSSALFYYVRARRMRAALANVDAFVMDSQAIADRFTAAGARVLPPSARVRVLSRDAACEEDIERIYEEVMKPR